MIILKCHSFIIFTNKNTSLLQSTWKTHLLGLRYDNSGVFVRFCFLAPSNTVKQLYSISLQRMRNNDLIHLWLKKNDCRLCVKQHRYEIYCLWQSCQSALSTGGHFFTHQPSEGDMCFWPLFFQLMNSDRVRWCFSFKSFSKHKWERDTVNSLRTKRLQCSLITLNWLKINNAAIATVQWCNELTGLTD